MFYRYLLSDEFFLKNFLIKFWCAIFVLKMSAKISSRLVGNSGGTRAKTANVRRELSNTKNANTELGHSSNQLNHDGIFRLRYLEMDFSDALKITGVSGCPQPPNKRKIKVYPTVLPKTELERLKEAAKVKSLEEKLENLKKMNEETNMLEDACERRKKLLREFDEARIKALYERKGGDIKDNEILDIDDRKKVLERAFLAKHESEEEVKRANRIILEAKCHVIREAQVAEKNELAREMRELDRKLEKIMLEEEDRAFQGATEKFRQMEEEKKKYATEIKRQLAEQELLKQKEADRIEEEAKIRALAIAAMENDEELKTQKEREKKIKLKEDLNKISETSRLFKRLEFESERQAEMNILEYMKQKEEREKKIALERKLAKEAFERQQIKLIQAREKALTTQSEYGEFVIRREQEKKEREYRMKERAAALKKKQQEEELVASRKIQMEDLRQRQALQIARDEADFNKIVAKLKIEAEQEKEVEEKRLRDRHKYREEIIHQMNMKEMDRRELERQSKNEYMTWLEKEKNRDKNIRVVIEMKLEQMRKAKLPEKYMKDVVKQLQVALK